MYVSASRPPSRPWPAHGPPNSSSGPPSTPPGPLLLEGAPLDEQAGEGRLVAPEPLSDLTRLDVVFHKPAACQADLVFRHLGERLLHLLRHLLLHCHARHGEGSWAGFREMLIKGLVRQAPRAASHEPGQEKKPSRRGELVM